MTQARTLSLFVFVDALGWERVRQCSFAEDLLPFRQPLDTILGYSSTCDPTFLTGRMPREHGHFAFFAYDPEASPFRTTVYRALGWLPKTVMNRGRVRARLSKYLARMHGFTGYFHIYNMPFRDLRLFDYTERKDIFRPGGINGGLPTVFDHLTGTGVRFALPPWQWSEEERIQAIEGELRKGQVSFAYCMLGKLDAVLHQYGVGSTQGQELLARYEALLKRFIDLAKDAYDEFRLFVFSDHGMTNVTTLCDLIGRIQRTGLVFGRDYAAVYDATVGRFWFLTERARPIITRALQEEPLGDILSEDALAGYGCDFPDHRYGELFFLMKPGVLICPSFMGERPIAAMHGYAPEHPDSTACLLSNVAPQPAPRRLEEMYGLMREEASRGQECPSCPA